MQVGLKIWRYDSATGERALREYEIEAPEEATLLDCLDIVKDRHDGTLAYRKSCRMMICGSCGMRMDGAAVLACKTRMYDIAQEGRVPVISAMGNLPIVKDLVVDMDPFWEKFKSMKPYLQPGYERPGFVGSVLAVYTSWTLRSRPLPSTQTSTGWYFAPVSRSTGSFFGTFAGSIAAR